MVNKSFNIDVDIKESLTNRPFEVVQGDTGNIINISVLDDGQPVDLTGCRVLAVFSKSSGTSSQDSGVSDGGITISGNTVHLQLFTSSFDLGMIECELQIYSDAEMSTLITTAKFNFKARRGILNDDTVQSTNEYPILVELIEAVRNVSEGVPWLPRAAPDLPVFTGPDGVLVEKTAAAAREALDTAAASHAHGSITNDGKIGEAADLPLFTGAAGAVGTKTAAEARSSLGVKAQPAKLTALPASGTALTENAEYRVAAAVATYVFAWPINPFECWLRFTTAATFSLTFPAGTTYIGGAPTFKASTAYEMSVKDGVVVVQEVAAA